MNPIFGYIVVNKKEMKFKEFDAYHAYYCGLCRQLKKHYGAMGQITLSYDMTFLAILLSGLYEPEETESTCKCIAHPMSKHSFKYNDCTKYVADMNLILSYYKCLDDWEDEHKLTSKLYSLMIHNKNEKLKNQYEHKINVIKTNLENINKCELKNESNIDILSGYFGEVMGEIFAIYHDEWEDNLRRMGYFLGKFIYILDAYDDLKDDIKKNRFNPFKERGNDENFHEWVKQILIMSAAEVAKEFEKLPILYNVEILRNIIYSGIWTRYNLIDTKEINNERSL